MQLCNIDKNEHKKVSKPLKCLS